LIDIGGGVARPYHFISPILVVLQVGLIPKILNSKVFISLLFFFFINIIAIIYADDPTTALFSYTSFMANVSIAMSTAMILISSKLSIENFVKILMWITIATTVFGIFQIIFFKAGVILALSEAQESQILIGFGPGFSYEANTFAKFMIIPFFVYLSFKINNIDIIKLKLLPIILLVGVLMNFTRTAIIGIISTLCILFIWYFLKGKLIHFFRKTRYIVTASFIAVVIALSSVSGISSYAKYKMESLFEYSNLSEDSSGKYRLEHMQLVIDRATSDNKILLVGNGWGQTYFFDGDKDIQVGGGDMVNILGFSGLIGLFTYMLFIFISINESRKSIYRAKDKYMSALAEGVTFSLIAITITSQMSGMLITSEFWMLIGLSIYLSVKVKKRDTTY
jgi:hypothetical protein